MLPFSAVFFAGIAQAFVSLRPPTGITPFKAVPWWSALLNYPPVKALLPIPILLMLAPALYWFFRKTWYAVNEDAARMRQASGEAQDSRPFVCFALTAVILTMQEYYGGRDFFSSSLRPILEELEGRGQRWVRLETYDELYGYAWWVFSRFFGYVAVPIAVWKLLFPEDRVLDMGLRARGFLDHVWVYALCLVVVMAALLVVAQQPDFGTYYPFYKQSSRSWSDFLAWEAMYFLQFLGLEFFFRGWMLSALRRTLGASAIFAMALPYCMIHYGKPYLEAHGALVAGIVLGSLAMRTRSIYAGFLVHVAVAFSMDYLALARRSALPTTWFPS